MEEITPKVNIVVYLIANALEVATGKRKNLHYLGGHGYTYDLTEEGKKKLAKDVATSNGYYTGNKQKPNTVVVVKDIVSLIVPNAASHLEAVLRGFLEILKPFVVHGSEYKNLCVITPHREMDAITRLKPGQLDKDGFKFGTHIPSTSELKLLRECVDSLETMGRLDKKVIIDLAGSAEGGMGNREANKQLELAEVDSVWSDDKETHVSYIPRKEYENPESDFNKIVSASRWYFLSNNPEAFFREHHGYRVYGFGKVDPDKSYYGKLTPDVTYSKLYTKKPIQLLDKLFAFTAQKIDNPDGYLSAGDLNNLVSKDVARLLDTIPAIPRNTDLISPVTKANGKPVLIELIKPVLMSYRIRDFLESMDVMFNAFMEKDEHNKFGYMTFYDITDQVYLKEVNGKGVTKLKLQPDFTQLKSTFKVKVEHPKAVRPVEIMLSVGLDIPERNAFNSVEDPNVRVWAMADTRNNMGVRYGTVVETDEFIYILTSAAANLKVLSLADQGRSK